MVPELRYALRTGRLLLGFIGRSITGPWAVVLESSSACQADCLMCHRGEMSRAATVMPVEIFEKALADTERLSPAAFQLSFYGEPLLDDGLEDKIARVRSTHPGAAILLNTNGNLITGGFIACALAQGVTEIRVSVEGATPDEYERIRANLKYERLRANLARLKERRDEAGSPMRIVICGLNLEDDPIDQQRFREAWSPYADCVFIRHENRSYLTMKENLLQKISPCFRLFAYQVVMADGSVTMCDMDWYGKHLVGDVSSRDLKSLWRSRKLVAYRLVHLLGLKKLLLVCRTCSYRPLSSIFQNRTFRNLEHQG